MSPHLQTLQDCQDLEIECVSRMILDLLYEKCFCQQWQVAVCNLAFITLAN